VLAVAAAVLAATMLAALTITIGMLSTVLATLATTLLLLTGLLPAALLLTALTGTGIIRLLVRIVRLVRVGHSCLLALRGCTLAAPSFNGKN
jgi:hypothetical protein